MSSAARAGATVELRVYGSTKPAWTAAISALAKALRHSGVVFCVIRPESGTHHDADRDWKSTGAKEAPFTVDRDSVAEIGSYIGGQGTKESSGRPGTFRIRDDGRHGTHSGRYSASVTTIDAETQRGHRGKMVIAVAIAADLSEIFGDLADRDRQSQVPAFRSSNQAARADHGRYRLDCILGLLCAVGWPR